MGIIPIDRKRTQSAVSEWIVSERRGPFTPDGSRGRLAGEDGVRSKRE